MSKPNQTPLTKEIIISWLIIVFVGYYVSLGMALFDYIKYCSSSGRLKILEKVFRNKE